MCSTMLSPSGEAVANNSLFSVSTSLNQRSDFLLGFWSQMKTRVYPNGSQVDQGVARKAQPEPEGEMEETETPADPEAPLYLIR